MYLDFSSNPRCAANTATPCSPTGSADVTIVSILRACNIPTSFFIVKGGVSGGGRGTGGIVGENVSLNYSCRGRSCDRIEVNGNDSPTVATTRVGRRVDDASTLVGRVANIRPGFFHPPFVSLGSLVCRAVNLRFVGKVDAESSSGAMAARRHVSTILGGIGGKSIVLVRSFKNGAVAIRTVGAVVPALVNQKCAFIAIASLFGLQSGKVPTLRGGILCDGTFSR